MTCELAEVWIDGRPCRMIFCSWTEEKLDRRKENRERRQGAKGTLRWLEIEEALGRRVGRKAMRRYLARQKEAERNEHLNELKNNWHYASPYRYADAPNLR